MPKRNIPIWMSDGADDLENTHGSWRLQSIEWANSLKMREYDFHFRLGLSTHDSAQAAIDLPNRCSSGMNPLSSNSKALRKSRCASSVRFRISAKQ
jgi:hypothetical protein